MDEIDPKTCTLKDLMAAVGLLLLQWGGLEQAVATAIQADAPENGRAALPIGDGLARWAELVRERRPQDLALHRRIEEAETSAGRIRQMRNNLCHRLHAARADPGVSEPRLICEPAEGPQVEYSWSQLVAAIRDLEQIRDTVAAFRVGAGARSNAADGA
jgi:hypothetical protein